MNLDTALDLAERYVRFIPVTSARTQLRAHAWRWATPPPGCCTGAEVRGWARTGAIDELRRMTKWRANRTRWRTRSPRPHRPHGWPDVDHNDPADIVADRLEAVDFLAELERDDPALSMLLRHAAGETLAEIGATEGVTEGRVSCRSSPSTSGDSHDRRSRPSGPFHHRESRLAGVAPRSAQWVNIWAQTGRTGSGVGRGMLNVYAGVQGPRLERPGYPVNVTRNRPWPMLDYWWTTYGGDPGGYPDWQSFVTQQGWDEYLLVAQEGGPTWEVIGVDRGPGGWWAALWGRRRAAGGAIWDANYTPHMTGGLPAGVCAASGRSPRSSPARMRSQPDTSTTHSTSPAGWVSPTAATPRRVRVHLARPVPRHRPHREPRRHPVRGVVQVENRPPAARRAGRADHRPGPQDPRVHPRRRFRSGDLGAVRRPRIGQATFDALRSIPITAFEAVDTEPLRLRPSAGVADRDYWACR